MKKKVLAAIGAMAVAGMIGFAFSQSGVVNADPNLTHDDVRKQVNNQYPGTITELELEKQGKQVVYEVEIQLEGKEYDLEIDGNTGEVLKLEETIQAKNNGVMEKTEEKDDASSKQLEFIEKKEEVKKEETPSEKKNSEVRQNDRAGKQNNEVVKDDEQDKKTEESTSRTVISLDEAKRIAKNNFSGKVIEIELDDDDGRSIYDVEMENGDSEAEIEIDAYTGEVIMLEIELDDDDD